MYYLEVDSFFFHDYQPWHAFLEWRDASLHTILSQEACSIVQTAQDLLSGAVAIDDFVNIVVANNHQTHPTDASLLEHALSAIRAAPSRESARLAVATVLVAKSHICIEPTESVRLLVEGLAALLDRQQLSKSDVKQLDRLVARSDGETRAEPELKRAITQVLKMLSKRKTLRAW